MQIQFKTFSPRFSPLPVFKAVVSEKNSRVNDFMLRDLCESDITYLPQGKVAIGRAPGGAKYEERDKSLEGYIYEQIDEIKGTKYGYDPKRLSSDIKFLSSIGVDTIIDVRHKDYEGEKVKQAECAECEKNGIKYVSIGLDSALPPTGEDLCRFFDAINKSAEGKKVYIHCHAGKDRTGIMSACYLAKYQGMDKESAFKEVFDNRPDNERPGRHIQRLKYMSFPGNIKHRDAFIKFWIN